MILFVQGLNLNLKLVLKFKYFSSSSNKIQYCSHDLNMSASPKLFNTALNTAVITPSWIMKSWYFMYVSYLVSNLIMSLG
jgi:hypothetical protein